jgi:YVTN family beta-propeller protein
MLLSVSVLYSQEIFVVNSNSQTLSKVNITDFSVNNSFAQIGLYGNQVLYDNDRLYVVNSGDNRVQIINADTGATQGYINTGNSSSPYNIALHDGFAYITGWGTHRLYKVDLSNTSSISQLTTNYAPQGMLIVGNKMYVALSGYVNTVYLQGRVCVVDLNTFTVANTINVNTNPQSMVLDGQGRVHVICSGNYGNVFSVVSVINTTTDTVVNTITLPTNTIFTTIHKGVDGLFYVGSGYGLGFLTYNPATLQIVNGAGNYLFPNGDSMIYDSNYIYVLEPSYYGASSLKVFTHEKSLVSELNLGVGSVSMVYKAGVVSEKDIVSLSGFEVSVYPNPFVSGVNIKSSGGEEIGVEVFNIKGQRVYSESGGEVRWEAKEVPAGMYFMRVRDTRGGEVVKKIIKMK